MKKSKTPLYLDPAKPTESRIKDLISRMTLEEKISQMIDFSPAIPRLGIPEYAWWNECLHGVARAGKATVFPQAIGMAAAFDRDLLRRVGTAISDEARAKHHAALKAGNRRRYHGLTFWTPNVNIFRDPRWGRGQETYGEDPYLTGELGAELVKGLQGNHPRYLKIAACAKHFAVHSGPEKLRHDFNAEVSAKDLHETYLPAFKKLVDAGVESVMGAYNRTNGEPCCASPTLLTKILREKWGFTGHVVSDCAAIADIHAGHHVTSTMHESAALAVKSGCDLNCGNCFLALSVAVRSGMITEKEIEVSLARLLRTRFKLGQFDPASKVPYAKISPAVVNSKKHKLLAYEAAKKSFVLLKNKNNLLPLAKDKRAIFLTGPNATSTDVLLGNYYGMSPDMVTFLEGLAGKAGEARTVDYRVGSLLDAPSPNPVDWATPCTKSSDVTVAVMGLSPLMEGEEGDSLLTPECGDRTQVELPQNQTDFVKRLAATGKPIIVVLTGGSAMAIPEIHEAADAVIVGWYPGEQGGNALADILFGTAEPTGRLPVTFPRSTEQLPEYTDYRMENRTYRYMKEDPLYPFGFGLTYTQFEYGPIRLASKSIRKGQSLKLEVEVCNIGKRTSEEVVQLYLSDLAASVPVPRHSLIGFQRVLIPAGKSKKVRFTIASEQMEIVGQDGERILESGEFKVIAAGSSPCTRSLELGAAKPAEAVFAVA